MQPRSSPTGVSAPRLASARQWERTVASDFLMWRHTQTSRSRARLESVCAAVGVTLDWWLARGQVAADAVARQLPATLTGCDQLAFTDTSEAMAYLVLHLADRYGRVTQALELLLGEGWLPIRRSRMAVLDVGGGPAPGLYAAVDLYDDLAAWAASTGQPVSPARVSRAHALDRGAAWDQLLHHFSEHLLGVRQILPGELPARLPFRRHHAELGGFSVLGAHYAERARIQRAISREYDPADDSISSSMAWQLAYQEPTDAPSAYELIVMCNFLTNTTMTHDLRAELAGLARSLTSGGVLLVLGATGGGYPAIYAAVNELATTTRLRPLPAVSRQLEANPDPALRDLIATQVRAAVSDIGSVASPELWAKVERRLRRFVPDAVDHDLPFTMPQFQILAFRRVLSPRRRSRQQDH